MYGFRYNAKNDIGPSDVHLRGFFMRKAGGVKPKAEGSKLKVEEKRKNKDKGEENRTTADAALGLELWLNALY